MTYKGRSPVQLFLDSGIWDEKKINHFETSASEKGIPLERFDNENNKASNNRTLTCSDEEISILSKNLFDIVKPVDKSQIVNRIINRDIFNIVEFFPNSFADLLILDPPYNLSKNFNGNNFRIKKVEEYRLWFENMIDLLIPTLKSQATIYVCSDWNTSTIIYPVLDSRFYVNNRITWEREKGRGSKLNWKNNTEDLWFCTNSKEYFFNVDSVKLKRKIMAPYTQNGNPKDWKNEENGKFRLTCPSNIWTDITVPFWSMPENTNHPTQKPEKLIAKLILASTKADDMVFDPFLGSGTSAVVAKKLNRKWLGVEINKEYCCWSLKRLEQANINTEIQGYRNGVFWERNSLRYQDYEV